MKKIKFYQSALLTLGFATTTAMAAQGTYIDTSVSFADADDMPSADTYGYVNTDLDERNTGFRLALGYSKDTNPNFGLGVELGYNNYGSDEYSAYGTSYLSGSSGSLEYKYTAIDLLGKATWHVSKRFDLYGKLGIAHETVSVSGDSDVDNNSETLPEFGIGTSYFATEKLALNLAVYHIQGDDIEFNMDDDNNVPSITSVNFGINYYFA